MDQSELVNITSRAWSLTILSLLHDGVPGRQAPLLAASGAGRGAFAQSLTHLVEIGLVERNPGHGHPLRPEFRLTERGAVAAAMAARIMEGGTPTDRPLLRRVWTLPVLTVLHRPRRFAEIRRGLIPGITDRALSQTLQSMERCDWVRRRVDAAARPPHPIYLAVNRGAEIARALEIDTPR